MPIPRLFDLTLPLLKVLGDGHEHHFSEAVDILASEFHLSDDERKEMLAGGAQRRFDNRVRWARVELSLAGLIEAAGRGVVRITERGQEVLRDSPPHIDRKFLNQFPGYREKILKQGKQGEREAELNQSPQEMLEQSYQGLRRELAQELLDKIKSCSPRFFEQLVVDLLVGMGYGGSRKDAGQAVGQSGDGGIDGIIKEDKLGLDVVYLQAKRWESTVGRPVVQAFAGSLEGQRARKGVLITTSDFSRDARDYVTRIEKKIVLIDGEQLAQLMMDHNIGVTEVASYTVKKADLDYFSED